MNDTDREEALRQVQAIAARVKDENSLDIEHPGGLFGGLAGRGLFLMYAGGWLGEERYMDAAWEKIEGSLAALEAHPHNSLDGGLIGLGWLLQHAINQGFIEVDVSGLLQQADEILTAALPSWFEATNRDYMHGATGTLLYWRHRNVPMRAHTLAYYFDEMLKAQVGNEQEGVHWVQMTDVQTGEYGTTVGLAHGIANMVRAFTWLAQIDIHSQECMSVVESLFKYLERHRLSADQESMYPFSIVNDRATGPSRLAWCHGDLGVAFAYWLAGDVWKNEAWKEQAISIWLHASARKAISGDPGIGLCHGYASLAYLFSRAYVYTGQSDLRVAAEYWQGHSLASTANVLDHADEQLGELLSGLSGVGLAHLHFLFPEKEAAWDEWMLLR